MGTHAPMTDSTDIARSIALLDELFPLVGVSHRDVTEYVVYFQHLLAIVADGVATGLRVPGHFVEALDADECPETIVLARGGLCVELEVARAGRPGDGCIRGMCIEAVASAA